MSFVRICGNARYENGKMRLNLRDKNLYYELKNQIDESGGFVETTLTQNLLVVTPAEFFGIIEQLSGKEEVAELKKALKKKYQEDEDFCRKLEQEPTGKVLKQKFGNAMVNIVCDVMAEALPLPVGIAAKALKAGFNAVRKSAAE